MGNSQNAYAGQLICDPRCAIFFFGSRLHETYIYSVSWKVFRHRIEEILIKIMEFDILFLSREISFPFPKK